MFHSVGLEYRGSFDNLFRELRNLESIDIQYNLFDKRVPFNTSAFSNIIDQFPLQLKSVYVDIPPDLNFAQFFKNFTELTNLGINAKDTFRMNLNNDTFRPLKNLPIRSL